MKVRSVIVALAVGVPLAAAPSEKPKLSFVKDIVPIFTKSGCANSNCHGSIRGQAGFKLSLFGYEPDLDYDAIVKAQDGRRIDRTDPTKSLILMKPTFSTPHGGGRALQSGFARIRGDSGLDQRRRHLRQRRIAAAAHDSRNARRSDAGRSEFEAAAFGFGNLHGRLNRRPDAQGAVLGQRRIGSGCEPERRDLCQACRRNRHHGAHARQGGGGAHRGDRNAADERLSRSRPQQFHRRPDFLQAQASEYRSIGSQLRPRICAARLSRHHRLAADARRERAIPRVKRHRKSARS